MTPAQAYLAKRQRRYPPSYPRNARGADRAQQLCGVLMPALPQALQALLTDGTVAVAEIGRYVPDVRTLAMPGGGFAIEFATGMMDFDYSVGRALAGVHVGHTEAGPENKRALEFPGVVTLIADVFEQWKSHVRWSWLWPRRRIEHADFAVAESVRQWIETLVTTAELYMLAHELAHVALDSRLCPPIHANDEENADAYGLQFFLPVAESRAGRRRAYAGAVFAISLFAGLERLGVRFADAYPPQARRVALIREQIQSRSPSTQFFHEASTIMVAYQDIMEDVENRIAKDSPAVLPDAERTLVRLIAELEEVARGRVAQATFVEDIIDMAGRIPQATMQQAAAALVGYYVPPRPDGYLSLDLRIRMAAALVATVDALPEHLRPLFPFPRHP